MPEQRSDQQLLSPQQCYQAALDSGEFTADDAQANAVAYLDQTWQQLMQRYRDAKKKKIWRSKSDRAPRSVYMWGGVGRGKTWLMDKFYDAIPFRRKKRQHFHHFMLDVHQRLVELSGQQNPLDTVADQIYDDAVVICFDEFFVANVTDAMILGDLFQKLFDRGITLIATSNIPPEKLYLNGIHRDRFLPTIDAILTHGDVLNVDAGVDYRLRILQQAELFHTPLGDEADQWMASRFKALTEGQEVFEQAITVNNRELGAIAHTKDVLWSNFNELCLKPRSPSDFIQIANRYPTVLISNVPSLKDQIENGTRRFIYMIDEFYDRRVKVVITSQDSILKLYDGTRAAFEIERTRSRLLEMQSDAYLQQSYIGAKQK